MNWEGHGRKCSWPNLSTIPAFTWGIGDKSRKPQDTRSPGRYLNPGRPEYEVGMLTTRPRHLAKTPTSFIFRIFMFADQMKDGMGRICSTHRGEDKFIKKSWGT
jgi:hypothetical protein